MKSSCAACCAPSLRSRAWAQIETTARTSRTAPAAASGANARRWKGLEARAAHDQGDGGEREGQAGDHLHDEGRIGDAVVGGDEERVARAVLAAGIAGRFAQQHGHQLWHGRRT